MIRIDYTITSGAFPVTVELTGEVILSNIHYSPESGYFSNLPEGNYEITFIDSENCTGSELIYWTTTTTTSTSTSSTTTTTTIIPVTTTTTTTMVQPTNSIDVSCVSSSNAITYQTTPTYDGSGQSVHPDIYFNAYGWNGYKYWMAMTPYPSGNDAFENPSILVSNDGDTWSVPVGLTNPIIAQPVGGYNSDPDIFMGYDGKLWMVYREVISTNSIIYALSSSDGITWSSTTSIVTGTPNILSPSVIKDGGIYKMYFVDYPTLTYKTCATPDGTWSASQVCSISGMPVGRGAWHVDVMKYGNQYHMTLVTASGGGGVGALLYFGVSSDGVSWTLKSTPIIPLSAGWDNSLIYRGSSVLMYDGSQHYYDLWYSARSAANVWHIGRTTVDLYDCPVTTTTTTTGGGTTTTTTTQPVNLTLNLLAVWELDEISGTTINDSHGVFDGTVTNALINQTGILDKAVTFDGSGDYISMGNVLNFERTTPFSISCWVKTGSTGARTIIGKMNNAAPNNGYSVLFNNGVIQFYLINTFASNYINLSTISTYNNNVWRHIVVTYNGDSNANNVKIYVDGVSVAFTVVANNLSATTITTVNFSIGSRNASAGVFYIGSIDQCAVWDRVLNLTEVETLYNLGAGLLYTSW